MQSIEKALMGRIIRGFTINGTYRDEITFDVGELSTVVLKVEGD